MIDCYEQQYYNAADMDKAIGHGDAADDARPYVVVVDAGTTGIRAVVVDRQLKPIESVYEPIPEKHIVRPVPGWVRAALSSRPQTAHDHSLRR